jgi:ribosome-associated protein
VKDPIQQRVRAAVAAALDKKAFELDVLQVTELTSIADYFVICSANTERQTQAIADNILEKLRQKA